MPVNLLRSSEMLDKDKLEKTMDEAGLSERTKKKMREANKPESDKPVGHGSAAPAPFFTDEI